MSPTGSHNPNAYDARLTFEIRFVAYETKDVVDRLLNERYTDEIFGKQYSTQPFSPLITLLARQIRVVTEQPCIDVVDRFPRADPGSYQQMVALGKEETRRSLMRNTQVLSKTYVECPLMKWITVTGVNFDPY